jgi:hypothetical protein
MLLSIEPSLTAMTSISGHVCARTDSIAAATQGSAL